MLELIKNLRENRTITVTNRYQITSGFQVASLTPLLPTVNVHKPAKHELNFKLTRTCTVAFRTH